MFKSLKRYTTPALLIAGLMMSVGCSKSEEASASKTEGIQASVVSDQPANVLASTDVPQPVQGAAVVRDTLWVSVSARARRIGG